MAITSARFTPTCNRMRLIIAASMALSPCGWMLRNHSPYNESTRARRLGTTLPSFCDSGSAARIR
ncbi:hypothetical protein D3C86_2262670 [compost metagenome]